MIKSVTVTNHLGESKKFELRFPEKSGFLIQSISGLGPAKANINSTEIATNDGSIFNSARLTSRNIVLSLALMMQPTVEDIRLMAYKYFPIKKRIKLIFETDRRTAEIYGYVESNEPDIFSKYVTTQISIICPDPYFYSAGQNGIQRTIFYGIEPLFEFPFSNESLTENTIIFGEIVNLSEQSIFYNGDSDVGLNITINATGEATNVAIYNALTRDVMYINTDKLELLTGSPIINGDEITISTVKGNKYINLLRDGENINILNVLDKTTRWHQLSRGDNLFAFVADTGIDKLQFQVENRIVYEGI